MSLDHIQWALFLLALTAANLPWLSERRGLFLATGRGGKSAGWRWVEWLSLYLLVGAIALTAEYRLNGEIYNKDWEFYAITLSLFLVFTLPGFIYRYDIIRKR